MGAGVFFILSLKREVRGGPAFLEGLGILLQEQHRPSFTYFLLLLTKICHPNLGSKNFACPAWELRAKKGAE